jgi:uncharacterized protein
METTMNQALKMTTRMFAILLLVGLGAGATVAPSHGQQAPERSGTDAATNLATELANDLVNRRLAAAVARFTPQMEQALPVPALDRVWSGLIAQGGQVQELGRARLAPMPPPGFALVIVPIRLERVAIDLKVSVAGQKIAGLLFAPAEAPPQTLNPQTSNQQTWNQQIWNRSAYVNPAKFTDVAVTVGAAPTALGGTLSLPNGAAKAPVVVLVHGSGPSDRDETIEANRPFRDIAEGLASRGIAALRYDKRTEVHPGQFGPSSTVREETIDDVIAAVALLAKRGEIDARRIVIVGHSLGGTLAPRIAAGRSDIAGIVIMAGATRPLPLLTVAQVEYIAALGGPPDDTTQKRIEAIRSEATRAMAAKAGDTGPNILGVPPSYWADLNAYDPAATAAKLSLPILILQGGRDYQVTAPDLQRFKSALAEHRNVTIREFPRLNHLFMAGEGKSRPEEYGKAGHVEAEVIAALADFVEGLPR